MLPLHFNRPEDNENSINITPSENQFRIDYYQIFDQRRWDALMEQYEIDFPAIQEPFHIYAEKHNVLPPNDPIRRSSIICSTLTEVFQKIMEIYHERNIPT